MYIKRAALPFCACCPVQHGLTATGMCTAPLPSSRPMNLIRSSQWQHTSRQLRAASVLHGSHPHKPDEHHHHSSHPSHPRRDDHHLQWPTTPKPTPYEIFGQEKSAPYSKSRFYELAKLYHPDRHHHTSRTVSRSTKIERYRLVVAANAILCDPAKRRQYDLYGAGWNGQADMHNTYREAEKAWRQHPGSAAHNATWEDWENWHEQRDGKKQQEPLYMSNSLFAAAIVLLIGIGVWGRATTAGKRSLSFMEMQEEQNRKLSRDLRAQQFITAPLNRQDRVDNFIRSREGSPYEFRHHPGHVEEAEGEAEGDQRESRS
ncbi:uncharacterized protein E0L32_010196 [Thyridium curvatum]|uniref:J domain-containing protein n=1 Tax=Thyridium curvatum TaxID=1093900 RepID=A0A507AT78_9PEZI|nr:uncharacterized protein E0L32_010196 [Thyridium curvatum]TPX08129.1 hypothetical protein E0L32_010196 [Thyridium curvatum]